MSLPAGACETVAGSDHLDQLSTRVGTGIRTQDLSDASLAPYCSELSGQPNLPKQPLLITFLKHPFIKNFIIVGFIVVGDLNYVAPSIRISKHDQS